ncbi:hypothetical protein GCM10011573_17390 [Enterococcus wangshanyuanii]|uniref:Uncharacterized protein n=1 Tax=Enterococcus wangshanyuanii TaxID=2005703 RepID=A0ABQ1P3N5_9ENTE|nr:hypothetical protein GCM10011573_17390 [Enterococcus wangshanyuanii]
MDNVNLSTFPANKHEALTMLFLQNQDISNLTPEELVNKYKEVYKEIKSTFSTGTSQRIGY